MIKKFECKKECKNLYVESVSLGCKKCIKKRELVGLSDKQKIEIAKLINN